MCDVSNVPFFQLFIDICHGTLRNNSAVDTCYILCSGIDLNIGDRCCSYDGDADRIVYYYKNKGKHFLNARNNDIIP